MPPLPPDRSLAELERDVQEAFRRGHSGGLDVLGYGEVSLVLRLDTPGGAFACKRLPTFPDTASLARYERTLNTYLCRLASAGLRVASTHVWHYARHGGGAVAYCVQPVLPVERLATTVLRAADDVTVRDFAKRFLDIVEGAVTAHVGLDAQAANWIDQDGDLVYLDVTTPLLRDAQGRELLDVRLFFTSLPWALRDAVRVTMRRYIFNKFYDVRGVVLDFLGNLHKEGLGHLVPIMLKQANDRLDRAITSAEVLAYYRSDARMWEVVQRLRRADRVWQRGVRHRQYPFLLPPRIDR